MENEKEFFKLYPFKEDKKFWDNISTVKARIKDPYSLINNRFENFNALEILEAGEDKPILNIKGLMEILNNPKYEKVNNIRSIISIIHHVYHYLPEQMFRIFAISQNTDPKYETAKHVANECMQYYFTHGGDFEFIKLGLYRASKEFNKRNSSEKIINFDDFKLFKTIKHLSNKIEQCSSLYDDVFETATGVFYLKEDLDNRGPYYSEDTINQITKDIEKGKDIIKKMIKDYDKNMLLNYLKTKKTYLKEQGLDLIKKMDKLEVNDFDDDEEFFHLQDQIEILEKNDRICDFLECIVKETEFSKKTSKNNETTDKKTKTENKTTSEKISTKAD